MSRVLEFRVWDKLAERFIFADKGYQGHYILDLNGQFYNLQNGSGGSEYVVQQYTGLNDKNGKKIFEGDIILKLVKNILDPLDPTLYKMHIPITFKNGSFMMDLWSGSLAEKYSVVGNIFENPELLK